MGSSAQPAPRPVIVLGCPRSGTTLFRLMLHAHPRMAIPPENRFVLSAYRARRRFGDLAVVANRERLADWILEKKESKVADLGLTPEDIRARIRDAPPTLGSALAALFRAYADRFGAARWGDKRPNYYQDVAALRRLFPDAQFIHLVRDGRDCVASLARQRWWRGDAVTSTVVWGESMAYGQRSRRRLGADAWFELRYEDLVSDPDHELRRVCDFLGERFDPAMTAPHEVAPTALPERDLRSHHERTQSPVGSDRVGAGRGALSSDELLLFDYVNAGHLRRWGYDVPDAPAKPPEELLAAYHRLRAERRRDQRRRHRQDVLDQLRSRRPVRDLTL